MVEKDSVAQGQQRQEERIEAFWRHVAALGSWADALARILQLVSGSR